MIKDCGKVADAIGGWIKEQVDGARARTAVVGLSGGADSALVALLALRGLGPERVVVVKMPCHSSKSSVARADELIEAFKLWNVQVDLGVAFASIKTPVEAQILNVQGEKNACEGALRSCLRAPTLDFVAKLTNGLVVGTGNRDEDEMTRYFQKRGDGAVDISPIAKLHKSEVYQLLRFLDCPKSIIEATPTADLWGPDSGQEDEKELGLTYTEVEWGIKVLLDLNMRGDLMVAREVLSGFKDPRTVKLESLFNERQQHVLKTLDRMERASRHKAALPPVCDVRQTVWEAFE